MARHLLVVLILFIGGVSAFFITQEDCYSSNSPKAVIGIDLGSTYCRVSTWSYANGVQIIPNYQGNLMTPSWISFTHNETFIGEAAKIRTVDYPESTFSFDATKFLGRKFEDEEVQSYIKLDPNRIVNKDGKPYFQVNITDGEQKLFSPEEITAMFLTNMKDTAEAFLGMEIQGVVITTPDRYWSSCFDHVHQLASFDAASMAGLNVRHIISEAQAAAMAYYLDLEDIDKNILVFDLGGGNFDVTILTFFDNWYFKILTTNGDTHLGGEDFDQRVMEYFMMKIKKKHGKDMSKDKKALFKLKSECERAKIALSKEHQVQVEIKSLFDGVDFSEPLTRAQFEELNMDLFNKTIGHVQKAMEDAGLKKQQIDEIILVGGSTRIPKVKQLLKDYFDGKEAHKGLEPDEVIAYGATREVAKMSVDCRIPPISHYSIYSLYPWRHSLPCGVRTTGGVFTKITSGRYVFPLIKSKVFTTNQDNQTRVSIQVYEGKGYLTKECRFLGKLELTGIPPAPRGTPRIEITFRIDWLRYINVKQFSMDVFRYINVKAKDKGTGKSEDITILRNSLNDFSEEEEINHIERLALPAYFGGARDLS